MMIDKKDKGPQTKRGRPTGTHNKKVAGALTLKTSEILETIKYYLDTDNDDTNRAILKEPKTHPGQNGRASSGVIYCPNDWADKPVLSLRLSPETASILKAEDLKAQADKLEKQAKEKKNE